MDNATVNSPPLADLYAAAVARHQAGRLDEAEILYRQILARQSDHAEALNLLGAILCASGRRGEAVQLITRAVQLRPDCPEFHFNLGNALRETGDLARAIQAYQMAVSLRPDFVHAVTALGQALSATGNIAPAVAAFEKAVQLRPDLAETQNNLGNSLCDAGRHEQAIGPLQQALAINPRLAGAHNNLGNALQGLGRIDDAIVSYCRAIELEPAGVQFLNNLAVAFRGNRQFDQCIEICRRVLQLDGRSVRALDNLGSAFASMGRLDQAQDAYRRALAILPDDLEINCNLAHVFYFKGQWDKAAAIYSAILARKSDYAMAHWSLALILLSLGDFQNGWMHYEWRWRVKELHMRLRTEAPRWDGDDLGGRTILLHTEQGFGDTIQFIRYAPQVAARGGRIILACQRELFSLLKDFPHIEKCIPNDQPAAVSGSVEHQVCCPLLSLPGLFGTHLTNIPGEVPYLFADKEKAARWQERMPEARLRIGLVWTGRVNHPNNHNRTLRPADFSPLAGTAGAKWFSLQVGPGAQQAKDAPMPLIDWTSELNDFSDTAALLENLDLLITSDTGVAHLAGAMGKRVWVLLPFVPDWRWLLTRSDSPWYPTMRLFRQVRSGDWTVPISQICEALREL